MASRQRLAWLVEMWHRGGVTSSALDVPPNSIFHLTPFCVSEGALSLNNHNTTKLRMGHAGEAGVLTEVAIDAYIIGPQNSLKGKLLFAVGSVHNLKCIHEEGCPNTQSTVHFAKLQRSPMSPM